MDKPINYFAFFDLPVAPTVDAAALKKAFYANSRRFHPDFHTLATPAEQDAAMEKSTHNNRGYKTLTNDDLRLRHLLELKGAIGAEGENSVPQDFLMDIMDINEALMELEFDPSPEAKSAATTKIDALEEELNAGVQDLLTSYDDATVTEGELGRLRDYYLKRRYLWRLRGKV